jgi:vacuolar iron transporter family protein
MNESARSQAQLDRYERYRRDEVATARLYRDLAELVSGERRELLLSIAETEQRHADHWARSLREAGVELTGDRGPWRHRVLLRFARWFGVERVFPAVVRAEAGDRDRYRAEPDAAVGMADEEAGHARSLALGAGGSVGAALALADGRHRTGSGGSLRAAVFGANDGLVSNLALIMGVAGGTTNPQVILLAGVAGLVAGAGSMAAGEWVSVRSQRELYERELEIERWELAEFPEDERSELELIYRAKGLDTAAAAQLADAIMADPYVALDTLAREELGLNPDDLGSPWMAATSSFLAFALGAVIPLLPFLFVEGSTGLLLAAGLSAAALAAVGALISLFTGRAAWWSALRMILIGGGAATAAYLIGSLVGVTLD